MIVIVQLNASEKWFCPKCCQHQDGAVKTIHLSSLPDILIVQLKRFKQVKLCTCTLHIVLALIETVLLLGTYIVYYSYDILATYLVP